jgi:hypothetical protein
VRILKRLMKPISFWVPATVCAVISLAALVGSTGYGSKWCAPAFYAFLPMCFFFVGSIMFRMHREISRLRHRVGRLEHRQEAEARREAGNLTHHD